MTPCEERGWKVGDRFRVVGNRRGAHRLNIGQEVRLSHDDGTDRPEFIADDGCSQYIYADDVEFIQAETEAES